MLHSIVHRTRQNHALEHATLHMLTRDYPQERAAGFAYPTGFTIITRLTPEAIYPLVEEALQRLQAGESQLRLHPNCGTTLATTALLVSTVALIGLRETEPNKSHTAKVDRWARLVIWEMAALVIAAPLGILIQATLTTETDLSDLRLREIVSGTYGQVHLVHVHTKGG